VHVGTPLEENAGLIQVAQSAMEEEGKSAQSPIGKEKMGETKSEFIVAKEEGIIDNFLLSFEGPILVDESTMERSSEEDLAVPTCPLEQQIEEFDLENFMIEKEVIQEQDGLQAAEEGEDAPNPKEEEYIPYVEEKNVGSRALNTKYAIEEPSVLPSTSSLSSSNIG
ncbi:hypothetical protein KI387_026281, partial [Taxus chinensis]